MPGMWVWVHIRVHACGCGCMHVGACMWVHMRVHAVWLQEALPSKHVQVLHVHYHAVTDSSGCSSSSISSEMKERARVDGQSPLQHRPQQGALARSWAGFSWWLGGMGSWSGGGRCCGMAGEVSHRVGKPAASMQVLLRNLRPGTWRQGTGKQVLEGQVGGW